MSTTAYTMGKGKMQTQINLCAYAEQKVVTLSDMQFNSLVSVSFAENL